jgi:hypothetical protein
METLWMETFLRFWRSKSGRDELYVSPTGPEDDVDGGLLKICHPYGILRSALCALGSAKLLRCSGQDAVEPGGRGGGGVCKNKLVVVRRDLSDHSPIC